MAGGIQSGQRLSPEHCAAIGRGVEQSHKISVDPSWKVNREELAFVGGFYSGEGSCGTYDNRIKICAVQKEIEPLERLQKAFGGIGHIYVRRSLRGPMYHWQIGGFEPCQAVLAMLWPWLTTTKREQYKKAAASYREARGI